jgi:uncharacterized protein (TIGR03086 family)
MTHDLTPAADRMTALIQGVSDDQLDATTPSDIPVAALLAHIAGLTLSFTEAAKREGGDRGAPPDPSLLGDDWRTRVPTDLSALAAAWTDPETWAGMTKAGGGDMPAEVAGLVALDELVLHGWDLAVATDQPYHCDLPTLEAAYGFVAPFSEPGMEAQREGLFGPVIEIPEDAPMLHRLLGLSGRDPNWSPPS